LIPCPLKHISQHQHYDSTALITKEIIIIDRFWLSISAILAAILDSEKATRVARRNPG